MTAVADRSVRERTSPSRSAGGAAGWLLRTLGRRLAGRRRILAAVGVVALLATTLVSALALLVSAAEVRSVRTALTEDPGRTVVTVWTEHVDADVEEVRSLVAADLATRLGVPVTVDVQAATPVFDVPRPGGTDAVAYLGEVDHVAEQAVLLEGTWPQGPADPTDTAVPVAVPAPARTVLGLELGDEVPLRGGEDAPDLRARVVGVYDVPRPDDFWSVDRFRGALHVPEYPLPEYAGLVVTDAFGPLVAGPGTIDALDVDVARLVLRHHPELNDVVADDLPRLREGVDSAETGLSRAVGDSARRLRIASSPLGELLDEVSTTVVVARAGVTVVALLLVVLAGAALLQTARLLAEARHEEHDLMRARGASRRQVLGGAALEVLPLVVAVALLAPLLAPLVLRALGAVTGLVPHVDGTARPAWVVGSGMALALGLVLLVPLLRAPETFVEAQQARARPDRRAVLARSGVDVLMVVLGGLAYWQLRAYRSPVRGSGTSMTLDPVLVAGPVVVLLAGALLCLRLLPLAARLTERIAARGRGTVVALASWEVGRRSARATSAVLLLTIALAVGSFSQAFLATWGQSQEDQARDAIGAPVVVTDLPSATAYQATRLSHPVAGDPQPVLRRTGTLWPAAAGALGTGRPPGGRSVAVLGLTSEARDLLDRGRLGTEGGTAIASLPADDVPTDLGVDLGDDVVGLSARLDLQGGDRSLVGIRATVRAMIADASGMVRTVDLGHAELNAGPVPSRVVLDDLTVDPAARHGSPRLVGISVALTAAPGLDPPPGELLARVSVDDVAVLRHDGPLADTPRRAAEAFSDLDPQPVDVRAAEAWPGNGVGLAVESAGPLDATWVVLEGETVLDRPVLLTRTAWQPGAVLPTVVTAYTARQLRVEPGGRLLLGVDGGYATLEVAGLARRVPTLGRSEAAVVDPVALSRTLAESGVRTTTVDEWWVDVADADLPTYLEDVGQVRDVDGRPVADRLTAAAVEVADRRGGPVHAPTPAALWLATLGAALVAALGFAVHTVVTVRAREVELAQLRAVGLPRRRLGAVVAVEALLLCGLGVTSGVGIGVLLARLVGPLVATSTQGGAPVPAVEVVVPWGHLALVAGGVVTLVMAVVLLVVRLLRTVDPGFVLRSEAAR